MSARQVVAEVKGVATMRTGQHLQVSFAVVALLFAAPPTAAARVQVVPLVPGVEPSSLYRVFVNEVEMPIGAESSSGRHFAIGTFQFSGAAEVRITVAKEFTTPTIRPLRFQFGKQAKVKTTGQSDREIHLSLTEPCKILIELDKLAPLVLVASRPDDDLPNSDDPNVIYFGPGVHEPGRIRVRSNQTVFLDAGAKVFGTIEGTCVENVRVTGRGHLYGTKHTDWGQRTYGIVFDRCRNITVEKIGIRDCYWWTTEFLLCDGVAIRDINIFTFNRNNGGLMIDGCSNLTARDSLLMTRDDCICPHALNAAGNGEEISSNMLFENLVLYNVVDGNAIRIGASFETSEVRDWTFRNIDVVARRNGGAAIYSDHSDWAVVRNLVFENFHDESSRGNAIEMWIAKTHYSCQTGYRDERGAFEGLYFINFRTQGGKIILKGFDQNHGFRNVVFAGCRIGAQPLDGLEDITVNEFVTNLQFLPTGRRPRIVSAPVRHAVDIVADSPEELVLDNEDSGFHSYGFVRNGLPGNAYGDSAHVGQVPDAFGKYAAAIYEPRLFGHYEILAYCGGWTGMDERAPWIIKHRDGYSRAYLNQNDKPGWRSLGSFHLDAGSNVRLVYPNYFEPNSRPVVADALKFVRISDE